MIEAECARNIEMAKNQFQQQSAQSVLALDKQQRSMAIQQQAASMQAQAQQYKLQMEMQQKMSTLYSVDIFCCISICSLYCWACACMDAACCWIAIERCCLSSARTDWADCCWNWFFAISMLRAHSASIIAFCVSYWWVSIFSCMLAWPSSAAVASFSCCVIVAVSRYGEAVAAP